MDLFSIVKKSVASIATTSLVVTTMFVGPSASAFSDVPSDAWFSPYVDALTEAGIFKNQRSFRPSDNMNRAEFVKTLVVAAGIDTTDAMDAGFDDVYEQWFAPYINAAVENGIINGSDKSSNFRPGDNITRAEAVKIALNAFAIPYEKYMDPAADFVDDNNHWAEDMISAAYNLSIVDGKGGSKTVFAPNELISRSAVAKIASYAIIAYAYSDPYARVDGVSGFADFNDTDIMDLVSISVDDIAAETDTYVSDNNTDNNTSDNTNNNNNSASDNNTSDNTDNTNDTETKAPAKVVSDGGLEVSLSPSTAASTTVPDSASNVPFLSFDLTANGDDITVTALTVKRTGV